MVDTICLDAEMVEKGDDWIMVELKVKLVVGGNLEVRKDGMVATEVTLKDVGRMMRAIEGRIKEIREMYPEKDVFWRVK
jgi:hypothetical protein